MKRLPSVSANRRRGFALIEVLVAVLFIGIFLLALLQVRNQALHQFIRSGDHHSGAWLAEMKMAEVISQDLPDPENEETWFIQDSGDFAEFDERVNDINGRINENWVERNHFAKFEWEVTKELIFIGPNFIGNDEDLDLWEQPLDDNGDPLDEGDPREEAAARVVRITLIVYLPELPGYEKDEEGDSQPRQRESIKLVTYVDPAVLFNADVETDEAPAPEEGP
ncbi:MAG: hypothetical protein K8I27_08140 [Planctomycetes bacterium]|nr:hypothetical protein [Planctomycetota bacterium]